MTRQSGFKERVRARMSATGESYAAARAHLDRGRPTVLNHPIQRTIRSLR